MSMVHTLILLLPYILVRPIVMFILIVYNVIHHVMRAQTLQINHAWVVILMVPILITMKNCKPVHNNVQMVIIKAIIIVCHVIKHA
jgi:hypothetical protein